MRSVIDCALNTFGLRNTVALRIIDPHAAQHGDDFLVLGELADRFLIGQMTDFIDRADHLAIDGIVQNLFHETAVDLEEIYREVLEVTEG